MRQVPYRYATHRINRRITRDPCPKTNLERNSHNTHPDARAVDAPLKNPNNPSIDSRSRRQARAISTLPPATSITDHADATRCFCRNPKGPLGMTIDSQRFPPRMRAAPSSHWSNAAWNLFGSSSVPQGAKSQAPPPGQYSGCRGATATAFKQITRPAIPAASPTPTSHHRTRLNLTCSRLMC